MSRLNRAGRMFGALCREVGFVRFLGGVEVAERAVSPVGLDGCPPLPSVAICAQQPGRGTALRTPLVLQVHFAADLAQIGDAVITDDAVDMVNVQRRHHTIEVQPREAMQEVTLAVDLDPAIPMSILGPNGRVDRDAVAGLNPASKHAGLRVVVENLLQPILRQFHLPSPVGAMAHSSMVGAH